MNIDAYTSGDFRLFFNDPRTRADYLQWAPLLLEAEEYHAGNRTVRPLTANPRVQSVTAVSRTSWTRTKRRTSMEIVGDGDD